MNEVRNTVQASQLQARPASSKGASETQEKVSAREVPETAEPKPAEQEAPAKKTPDDLQTAVASINDYVQLVQRDLHFTVDDDLDLTVVKVVDSHSGELIRQIPEDIFLELARKLKDDGELHLVNALG